MAQLLLRGAAQLLTLRGTADLRRGAALQDLGIVEDGSVLIQNGKIKQIGSTRRIENLKDAKGALVIPVGGCVVMPGFVDPGIQLTMHVRPGPAPVVKRKKMSVFSSESLTLMRSCLQHGTLNAQANAFSYDGSAAVDRAALRQLAGIGNNPVGMVRSLRLSRWPENHVDLEDLRERLRHLKQHQLAESLELSFVSFDEMNDHLWEVLGHSDFKLNLSWSGGRCETLRRLVERVKPRNVFCPVALGPDECKVLSQSGSIAVFSPCQELLQSRENMAARQIIEMEGAIALASGYDAKDAPTFSMQMVVALGVLRLGLTVEQAISATTINAAHALGRANEIGSLEPGKRADIVVLNLSDYREIPRRFGINHVGMAIRDGNLVINRNRVKASGI